MSKEGNDAASKYLEDTRAYISPETGLMIGGSSDIVNFTLKVMTQNPSLHRYPGDKSQVSTEDLTVEIDEPEISLESLDVDVSTEEEFSMEGFFDSLSVLSTYVRSTDVKEVGNYVEISGVRMQRMSDAMKKKWNTTRIASSLFTEVNGGGAKMHRFFVPEVLFILDKLIEDKSSTAERSHLRTLRQKLYENTWVKDLDKRDLYKEDLGIIKKKLNIEKPLANQVSLVEEFTQARRKHLQGALFNSPPGTGKTIAALVFKEAFHFDKCLVICPKLALKDPWSDTLDEIVKGDTKYWMSNGSGNSSFKDAEYIVCHYEFLEKIQDDMKRINPKDSILVWLDESHNLNVAESKRTSLYLKIVADLVKHRPLDLRADYPSIAVIHASGSLLKGSSASEVIPAFHALDPIFDHEARAQFVRLFGVNSSKGLDILNHRMNKIQHAIIKSDIVDVQSEERVLKVKLKHGDQYTLKVVREKIRAFVEEELTAYKKEMPEIEGRVNVVLEKLKGHPKVPREELTSYIHGIEKLHRDFNPREDIDLIKLVNGIERKYVTPVISELTDAKVWKRDIVMYKYLILYVRGRALGKILTGERIQMIRDMVKEIDFSHIIDSALKKTIIFSSYVNVVKDIENLVKEEGYQPIAIHQETNKDRDKLISKYRVQEELNPVVATFNSLGVAVPMTECSTVLLMNEPFRPWVRAQATSRAIRKGQDSLVTVLSVLLDTGSEKNLSERSLDIMEQAQEIVDKILNVGDDLSKVSVEDIELDYEISSELALEDLSSE